MPLQRRLPKRGFINLNRIHYKVLNVSQIDHLIETYELKEITTDTLYINGIIGKFDKVKILGDGEITSKISFKVDAFTAKAKELIEKVGGTIEKL
jgi:large subunit ribosomal protein L15